MLTNEHEEYLKYKGFYKNKEGEWVKEEKRLFRKVYNSNDFDKEENPFMVYSYDTDYCYFEDGKEYQEDWQRYSSFGALVLDQALEDGTEEERALINSWF